jgi:tol-pal system protein YbgF
LTWTDLDPYDRRAVKGRPPAAFGACVLLLALSGCAGGAASTTTTPHKANDALFARLSDQHDAQTRRITELETRIALLEQEARSAKRDFKPTETVRISKAKREEERVESEATTAVIRLHEDARDARVEPETPWVLPTAPAGVATRLEVVPMAGGRGGTASPAQASDPVQHYRDALAMIKERRFDEALAQLAIITRMHADHALAPQAQYWKGEAHYAARRYRESLIELEAFIKRHPSNPKVPDALLKAGLCNKHLGQDAVANRYFERVRKEHPGSGAAQSVPREGSS